MRVGNFGGFLFGGCNIDHQTAKFSGYTVIPFPNMMVDYTILYYQLVELMSMPIG